MNSHLVPDFQADMEEDCSIPTTSGFSRPKKPTTGEEEIMELLWHNGQVVIQSQNRQGPSKNKHPLDPTVEDHHPRINGHDQSNDDNHQQHSNLFMQDDEMATWLQHYPVLDDPIDPNPFEYADLLYTAAPPLPAPSLHPPPPPPQPASARQNFAHFSRVKRDHPHQHPYNSNTVVESNETPNVVVMEKTMTNHVKKDDNNVTRELTGGTCEMTVTSSSPVRSGASTYSAGGDQARGKHAEESVGVVMVNEDKKRKAKDQNECHSQDVEVEASEARKQARSSSTKRSRAAEVHNLSERRRRDRINEKMRALQELIPRCNKSDKASMLDEAIEYLKSLQMQVQMMSMGCGMVPMMYPGMQQYLPAMQMGMGMGMGMGMDMTMTRPPMVPYPSVLPPGSSIPNPAATISAQQPHNMGPRFPIVQFHMPQTGPPPVPDPSGGHGPTRQVQNPTHPRMPNFVDPYQQFLGMHQAGQLQFPQPVANKASTSKDVGNTENQQNG